jgi:hypothetical protein
MKSIFSETSKKTRRKVKIYVILAAFAAGVLVAAESRYVIFRLQDIETSPQNILPQHALWGTLSRIQERFWPFFWLSSRSYAELIERYYPVEIKLHISGWGRFKAEVTRLEPAFTMYWKDKVWFVSAGGKVWPAYIEEDEFTAQKKAKERPVLSWGKERTTPIDISIDSGNVFPSSLPIQRIMQWYEMLDVVGWSSGVRSLQAGVKEGQPVVRLVFYNTESGKDGASVLLADDPKKWGTALLAIKKIYNDPLKIPSGIFIDTTYEGKILVKNKIE